MRTADALAARVARRTEGEIDDLHVEPLDPSLGPDAVMRQRPFIIGDDPNGAFCACTPHRKSLSAADARDRLEQFLSLRGLDADAIQGAVDRYDDPNVTKLVPSPTLRATLLMLTGWNPYQATIDAVLDGQNPSGKPFSGVVFADTQLQDTVATLTEDDNGRFRLVVDGSFGGEPPEQLIPVVVHESLHGGGGNSEEEEVTANILDAIAYAEVLLVNPNVANVGTELSVLNNAELLALLNSTGRAGPGQLGISATPLGDVWLGNDLGAVDASSIRASIEADDFYASLPTSGTPGQHTFTALLSRFPGAKKLGAVPDFNEAALIVIDRGVGSIITPRDVVRLAQTLALEDVAAVVEGPPPAPLPSTAAAALAGRPFVPRQPALFSASAEAPLPRPLGEHGGRDALTAALDRRHPTAATHAKLLIDYDDARVKRLIPDPSLRAATLLLGAAKPWDATLGLILDGDNPDGTPLPVRFADLRFEVPVARGPATAGDTLPAILVNRDLKGEAPELLASYVVEGTLLHADRLTHDEAVTATLFGTLAYGNLLAGDPALARAETPGAVARNVDLLALLNSSPWPTGTGANAKTATVGFLGAPSGVGDILPGLYADATSFDAYVAGQPGATGYSTDTKLAAPAIFAKYLTFAGIAPTSRPNAPLIFDTATLGDLDARLGAFLSPKDVFRLARALKLGVTGTEH